jgi:hypothetical protein
LSVEQLSVVDIVSVDSAGYVVLTISDHLDWNDSLRHQTILEKKLNAYLAFVESGEILQRYPEAKGRPAVLKVVFKYKPDYEGEKFLLRATEVIESTGLKLRSEVFVDVDH